MAIDLFIGPYAFLSNFYGIWVELDGQMYPSVEHAFQAAKTNNPALRRMIQFAVTPAGARKFGRKVPLRPDWELVKIDVMMTLVRYKFRDPSMRRLLLETGDQELVESNTWGDTFWGAVKIDGVYEGENNLGSILMLIRNEIRHGK